MNPFRRLVVFRPAALLATGLLGAAAFAAAAAGDPWAPEPGFVSLFNGRDLTGWGNGADAAENLDGKTASADGRFAGSDGVVVVNERVPRVIQQLSTQRLFANDFVLRLEFRGSVGADSGIFIRGVQLQCRDYTGAGPYGNVTKYRPQDWNEIEITVKGGLAYATCNGQVLEPSMTIPLTGRIGLEGDLGTMEYRRIRIREAPAGR